MKEYSLEELHEMTTQVNSQDGSLEHLEYIDIGSINEFLTDTEPYEILRMAHFGDFNLMHDYFKFDGYGNFESVYAYQLEDILADNQDEIIERYEYLFE